MKLKNGKTYNIFSWSKIIYQSQLRCSGAMLTPVKVSNEKYNMIIIGSNRVIREGLREGFLRKEGDKIVTRFYLDSENYERKMIFWENINFELKRNRVKSIYGFELVKSQCCC